MTYQSAINDKLLPGSYTVVEGRNEIHTGTLSYLEGDIFEVEMSKRGLFKIGEAVKIVIYSQDGVFNFETTVIAANNGMLILLLPSDIQKRFTNKRTDPRVEASHKGVIYQISDTKGTTDIEQPIDVMIRNISVGGIGFSGPSEAVLRPQAVVSMNLELGSVIPCRISIIHTTNVEAQEVYGGKFVDPSQETLNSIRSFVLTRQIHNRGTASDSRETGSD